MEYLALSWVSDLPMDGPAVGLASAVRVAAPVLLWTAAAGWLLARGRGNGGERIALPPWRPLPALVAQVAVFAVAVYVAASRFPPGGSSARPGDLALVLALAAALVGLAIHAAVPLPWVARFALVRWRVPALALALGALIWRAAAAAEALWGTLSAFTVRAVASLLAAVPGEVHLDAANAVVGVADFNVRIAPECSGVDGLGIVAVFQALWFGLARSRVHLARAAVLLPIGIAAAVSANVLRIALLIVVGAYLDTGVALGVFHSKLGWLLFGAIALASVAVAERIKWFGVGRPGRPHAAITPATDVYVLPFLATLATALLTTTLSEAGASEWYWVRIAVAALTLLAFRRRLPRPLFAPSWVALAVGGAVAAAWIAWPSSAAATPVAPSAAAIALRFVGTIAVIPLVEELAFRGFLLRCLISPDFEAVRPRLSNWTAIGLSSFAFGAVHSHWLLGALSGIAFAALYAWRGRLADAIAAHAVANAAIAAAVVLFGRWDLWF